MYISGCQKLEEREKGETDGYGFLSGNDKNDLELDGCDGGTTINILKPTEV